MKSWRKRREAAVSATPFDVKNGKVTYEVGVDAQTGRVLENSKEGRHPN
jgi:hypothetical protein